MDDKRQLLPAIMGAIAAYIQMEQQLSSANPKPQPEVSQQQPNPTQPKTNNAK